MAWHEHIFSKTIIAKIAMLLGTSVQRGHLEHTVSFSRRKTGSFACLGHTVAQGSNVRPRLCTAHSAWTTCGHISAGSFLAGPHPQATAVFTAQSELQESSSDPGCNAGLVKSSKDRASTRNWNQTWERGCGSESESHRGVSGCVSAQMINAFNAEVLLQISDV